MKITDKIFLSHSWRKNTTFSFSTPIFSPELYLKMVVVTLISRRFSACWLYFSKCNKNWFNLFALYIYTIFLLSSTYGIRSFRILSNCTEVPRGLRRDVGPAAPWSSKSAEDRVRCVPRLHPKPQILSHWMFLINIISIIRWDNNPLIPAKLAILYKNSS